MRLFACLILFATGCGGKVVVEVPHPCELSDFVSGGVCVITNGYNIDPGMVEFTVDIIETGINGRLDRSDDLPVLLEDLMVSAEYVDPYDPKLAEDGERAYRGLAIGTKTIINYIDDSGPGCHEHYYVLGHELLHVISQYILEAPSQANTDHDVEKIFIAWASRRRLNIAETVEFEIYMGVWDKCEEIYGEACPPNSNLCQES